MEEDEEDEEEEEEEEESLPDHRVTLSGSTSRSVLGRHNGTLGVPKARDPTVIFDT